MLTTLGRVLQLELCETRRPLVAEALGNLYGVNSFLIAIRIANS